MLTLTELDNLKLILRSTVKDLTYEEFNRGRKADWSKAHLMWAILLENPDTECLGDVYERLILPLAPPVAPRVTTVAPCTNTVTIDFNKVKPQEEIWQQVTLDVQILS